MDNPIPRRLIVGLTGSSGAPFTVSLLHTLHEMNVDTYLIVSRWGQTVLEQETGLRVQDLHPLVRKVFSDDALDAPISSGSVQYHGVVVLPCSMTTLARIAHGMANTLIARCAHVALKEHRRLILCIRETPLSVINLENALRVARAGGIIMPMTLSLYLKERTLDALLRAFALRVLSLLGWAAVDMWRPDELE